MTLRIQGRRRRYSPAQRVLHWAAALCFAIGFVTLAACGLWYVDGYAYQHALAARFTPAVPPSKVLIDPVPEAVAETRVAPRRVGDAISKLDIPRIGISDIVVEGIRARDLRIGAGHIPGTALPGETGNVGIAAHRDTFFRRLRDIRPGDKIRLTTPSASYEYSVESTGVVQPSDVSSLQASSQPTLTLVTCYPFYFLGPAPLRFIVRARQVAPAN